MIDLRIPRHGADQLLAQQIESGNQLLDRCERLQSEQEWRQWQHDRSRWQDYTKEVLRHVFVEDEPAAEFERTGRIWAIVGGLTWPQYASQDHSHLQSEVNKVISIRERLALAPEPATLNSAAATDAPEVEEAVIFLVHGRDVAVREEVRGFLSRVTEGEHEVVILHEQANRGQTLIEKFEGHAHQAKFAVVLLAGDDVGGAASTLAEDEPRKRARQNVVFELGFFFGTLGRASVAVLYEPDVELPSDVDGLVYIPLDGEWKLRLARELRAAGLQIDLNKA